MKAEFFTRARLALRSSHPFQRAIDFLVAKLLHRLPAGWRKRWFAGEAFFCPVCESKLRGFMHLHRPYHRWCPVCWSLQRHRFIWLAIQAHILPWLESTPKRILHIAPEPGITARFAAIRGARYRSADLYNPQAMERMDICNIQHADASFDLIYCSHVLEHVPDDRRAMSEFYRVLSAGGRAVIAVPIGAGPTLEDPSITDPHERERIFGQLDHVRLYGPDFSDRLEQAGFHVTVVHQADLVNAADSRRYGLNDDESVYLCEKTPHTETSNRL